MPDAAAAPFLTSDGAGIGVGQRWNRFLLQAPFPGSRYAFTAEDVGEMDKVLITARRMGPGIEWRRRAWVQVSALENLRVVRCREAIEEAGWRYEITALPPAMTLQEWIAVHRPGFQEIEALVRQLGATLDGLHAEGLVHLNLRPGAIYLDETEHGIDYLLGGWDHLTLFNQPELVPIDVDPLYAPPEAAGLVRHAPGASLTAWDWWSLGRVVQHFVLGAHVLGVVLNRDVSVITPELRTKAELLLQEKEPVGVRAGAVEQTAAEPGALPLLRGLLTGAADARWRWREINRWLQHDPVREYYDLPRTARLWSHDGRVFPIPDAVEYFTQAAHWAEGEEMLFNPDQPGTFGQFLRETASYRAEWNRLCSVRELAASPAWADVPAAARRTITAAASWLVLSCSGGGRPVFRVRGHGLDTAGLQELLRSPGGAESVAIFRALLNPSVVEFVESLDPTAGRVLKSVATRGAAATKLAIENGWLDPDDSARFGRLLALSLERATALQERANAATAAYATSRHPELARMLGSKTLTPVEYVVLAFTAEMPLQCGYVTHADARSERYQLLKTEADRVATQLGWLRLHQVLRVARLWGAPWPVFCGVAGGLTVVIALLSHSVPTTIMMAAALLLSRTWLWQRVKTTLGKSDPQAEPWTWTDGYARSRRESDRVAATGPGIAALSAQMKALQTGMAAFPAEARRDPPEPEPRWFDIMAVLLASGLCAGGILLHTVLGIEWSSAAATPVTAAAPAVPPEIQVRVEHPEGAVALETAKDPQALLATGKYEIVDDGFGRRLRGPLQKWPFFAQDVQPLTVEATAPASPEQSAFAVVSASLRLQPYLRDSVSAIVAVRVPTTRGVGVLLFNGRDRRLLTRDVLLVVNELEDQAWYEFEGRRILYLANPLPIETTISLAPR